jgi:adenine-specific DNA methylase
MSSALRHLDRRTVDAAVRTETRHREVHLPPVSVFRWWARRTDAVNGALIEAVAREMEREQLTIADPFVGGGVIALSALRRGHRLYAQDLNPWAVEGLRTMLDLPARPSLEGAGKALLESAAKLTERAYGTRFRDGSPAQLLHSIRVATGTCTACGHHHRLFPHALVTLLRRKERGRPEAVLACRKGHLHVGDSSGISSCPECLDRVDPAESYQLKRVVRCPECGHAERLEQRAISSQLGWELVLVERSDSRRREIDFPLPEELIKADDANWTPTRRLGAIPEGGETRVLRRHGFRSWSDIYPARQRYVTEQLLRMAPGSAGDERVALALRMAIIGTTEMAGRLSRWDRFYLKSYEAMASHRFNFTTLAAEPHVVGVGRHGRGTLQRRLHLSARAADWTHDQGFPSSVSMFASSEECLTGDPTHGVSIVLGSSERMLLPDASVDLVLTDPPYHDDVQYHELSLPLRAWAGLTRVRPTGEAVAIPHSKQLSGHRQYREVLQRVFRELRRTLKPDGRLLFSYANREPAAWVNLFAALRASGLQPLGYALVRSENENDPAKRNGRACTFDLILELVPKEARIAGRYRPEAQPQGDEETYLRAVGDAFLNSHDLVNGWEAELVARLRAHSFLKAARPGKPTSSPVSPNEETVLPENFLGLGRGSHDLNSEAAPLFTVNGGRYVAVELPRMCG